MILPVYPGIGEEPENPNVILDPIRFVAVPEGYQNPIDLFDSILHSETLFRPADLDDGTEWYNYREATEKRTGKSLPRCAFKINFKQCEAQEHATGKDGHAHLIEGEFIHV